jgi:CheY-like chemotaxis protein
METVAPRKVVLVVDDDADIREAVRDLLEEAGYAVTTAENGRQGLDALQLGLRPCVVLLDAMMPVLDGAGFLRALRGDDALKGQHVVVMTASGKTIEESTPHLRKPMSIERLLQVLGQVC